MLACAAYAVAAMTLAGAALAQSPATDSTAARYRPTVHDAEAAARLIGLEFSRAERDSMLDELADALESYAALRALDIPNQVAPAIQFDPLPRGFTPPRQGKPIVLGPAKKLPVPANLEELAFASVRDLGELLRTRKITSTQLTRMYLDRLKRHGAKLECVVTLTEDLAVAQAARADAEIALGRYRGPLHGIPYGAKDLLAVPGYKTTWGAMPYREQSIDDTATVVAKLEEAGAVLVAKLTLGALAWGDVWFGGMTRNPWDLEQGSSGSSAGSAAATSAGLVAFAIGTETLGSIVSPSTRCGTTGLRPTYGRVSRAGAMALSWSMDKIGPICRTVEDCAIVFDAIRGPDGIDPTILDAAFEYDGGRDVRGLRLGYVADAFEADRPTKAMDAAALEVLRGLGFTLVPMALPKLPVSAMTITLAAEAAAAFDDLTRSNRDDLLVRQIKNAWPNVFRAARFIPAVEYIQANRARSLLVQEMHALLEPIDLYICPTYGSANLALTNLTGHPSVVLPNGFNEKGSPVSITFVGKLFDEATLLAVARAYQNATGHHAKHPPLFAGSAP
jgi:Asp-tRNA(Asn)/Glu-tRNA(Gln) amidotransferase A subunit family amidase